MPVPFFYLGKAFWGYNILSMKISCWFIIIAAGISLTPLAKGDEIGELFEAPYDTADARRLRIWVPVEKASRCQLDIVLKDREGVSRRKLFSGLIPRGYHNFYWDKKDDSGTFVPAGVYFAHLSGCGLSKHSQIEVLYLKGERESRVAIDTTGDEAAFVYELLEDSLKVSLDLFNGDLEANEMELIFSDSIHAAGKYRFTAPRDLRPYRGKYRFKLSVADFTRIIELPFRKGAVSP